MACASSPMCQAPKLSPMSQLSRMRVVLFMPASLEAQRGRYQPRLPSVNVAPVKPGGQQRLDLFLAEDLAQRRIDPGGHALQAAADVNGRAPGDPAAHVVSLLAQHILHIAA